MGALTSYLQDAFARLCPMAGHVHVRFVCLRLELEILLGYSPRADVLLEKQDRSRRLWIEFEVSRADSVANHVKFATTHLFMPQLHEDSFVAKIQSTC